MKNTNKRSIISEGKDELLLQHEIEQLQRLEDSKEKYRKIVHASISSWVKDFQSGHIKINTVDDLKKLIELDLQLQNDDD
ncbi:hypothetical protein [Geomicrobium sp. JCM 19039]|uniref:hypothetical protein n=1 Tax=Geomicrobium sp. JCM 19039 TaxID=1460636 RepID=UPI00045F4456|nr:hypothetical protein [Geomicrobium sp. JCM 19039]GAK11382.1 hypothetical protein JCM19039_1075 [Geomicrobium sp. JCM 19039]